MRLNRYLATSSGLSRRAADEAIKAGRVTVNGQLGLIGQAIAGGDQVELDGKTLSLPAYSYIVLNKPAGYVTSRTARQAKTIYELLPPDLQSLKYAGRLDKDSRGLLVLTDDGDAIWKLTHPSAGKLKRYRLKLDRPLSSGDISRLLEGIQLEDGESRLEEVRRAEGDTVMVSLKQGRNRQLRRTFAQLGYTVIDLVRLEMGPLSLGDLPEGSWKSVTKEEIYE